MRRYVIIIGIMAILLSPSEGLCGDGTVLGLKDCIDLALRSQPVIRSADENLNMARAVTTQAGSPFFPQVTASTGYSQNHADSALGNSITRSATTTLSASQLLYDFGRTGSTRAAAQGGVRAAAMDRERVLQEVVLNVKQAYYGLLRSKKLLTVAEQNLAQAEAHRAQAEAFYRAGSRPRFDVTRTEVEVNTARLGVINAKNGVRISMISLNNAMGTEHRTELEIEDVALDLRPVPSIEEARQEAVRNRPELLKLREEIRSAEERLHAEQALLLPNISAAGSYSWSQGTSSMGEYRGDLGSSWNAGITLSLPLFEGGLTRGRIVEAQAARLALEAQLEGLTQTVLLEVHQASADIENAAARLEVMESSLGKAKENLAIAQGRYQAGVGPFIEVTDAQVAELKAEVDHVQAYYDYHLAIAKLDRSLGRTGSAPGAAEAGQPADHQQ